jgi:hypothetical protein
VLRNQGGPSDHHDISHDDLTQYFEQAVSFIGRDWLDKQHERWYGDHDGQEPHPAATPPEVVKAYHAGLTLSLGREMLPSLEKIGTASDKGELNGTLDDMLEDLTDDIEQAGRDVSILYRLGEDLGHLNDAEIVDENWEVENRNLQEEYQEHLRNDDESLQRLFELQVGALYARQGKLIQFVDEGGENSKPTPDIRLPSQTSASYIECKRCDESHSRENKRQEILGSLFEHVATGVTDNTIVYFKFDDEADIGELKDCLSQKDKLVSDIRTSEKGSIPGGVAHKIDIPDVFQDFTIYGPVNDQKTSEILFIEDLVSPLVKWKLNEMIDNQDVYTYKIYGDYWTQGWFRLRLESPVWIGANYSPSKNSYSSRVGNQLSAASGKFETANPNILHINVPFWHEQTRGQVDQIRDNFKGALNVSKTVNRIFISWSGVAYDGSDFLLLRHVDPFPHLDPEGEFDNEFYSFDIDFEALVEDMKRGL